jgi:hypothetical protein
VRLLNNNKNKKRKNKENNTTPKEQENKTKQKQSKEQEEGTWEYLIINTKIGNSGKYWIPRCTFTTL